MPLFRPRYSLASPTAPDTFAAARLTRRGALLGLALAGLLAAACAEDRVAPTAPTKSAALGSSASLQADAYYPAPEAVGGWRKNTDPAFIQSVGLDPAKVKIWLDYCLAQRAKSGCILIKNGWIVAEGYKQATGAAFLYRVHSISKSFTVALFGRLLQDPVIGSKPKLLTLDSPIYDPVFLPPDAFPLSDSRKSLVTPRYIFFHRSAIRPEDSTLPWTKGAFGSWPNWNFRPYTFGKDAEYPDSKTLVANPPTRLGTDRFYSSVAYNHFSFLIPHVTGRTAADYLRRELLDPLGFGFVNIRKREGYWPTAHGLDMTARDFARLLYLFLRKGNWNGQQIFAPNYLDPFTTTSACWNIRGNKDGFFDVAGVPPFPPTLVEVPGSRVNQGFFDSANDIVALRMGDTPNSEFVRFEEGFLTRLYAALLP